MYNKFSKEDSQCCLCQLSMLTARMTAVLVWSLAVREGRRLECVEVNLEQEGGRVEWQGSLPSPSTCSSFCSARPACVGWSWAGGRCELRSALARKVVRLGSLSATAGPGVAGCLRGRQCHYTDNLSLVNCIEGNITR